MSASTYPLVVIAGPTGSGKSSLSLTLAELFHGEIINCDSVQLYRGLDVGSAKLPITERRHIPHHLLDVADPRDDVTAGDYAQLARKALAEVRHRGRLPVIVGGTGFYLRALLDGLSPAPPREGNLRLRLSRIAQKRPACLHRLLTRHDLAAAARIHPNDHQKLIRALELTFTVGKPATKVQEAPRDRLQGFAALKIGLYPDRKLLHEAINARTARMFAEGLVEETKLLLQAGVPATAKALQSLGYRQVLDYLNATLTLEQAIGECQAKTRQYAKRQITWFRREPDMHWLFGFGNQQDVIEKARSVTEEFLRRQEIAPVIRSRSL